MLDVYDTEFARGGETVGQQDDAPVRRVALHLTLNYRNDLNPARRSSTIACGCSHAAKCAPFGWRL